MYIIIIITLLMYPEMEWRENRAEFIYILLCCVLGIFEYFTLTRIIYYIPIYYTYTVGYIVFFLTTSRFYNILYNIYTF